jgi:uncharacterized protein YbbC (DUF1343 family)
MVTIGLEVFAKNPRRYSPEGKRAGLLLSAASVDRNFTLARDVAHAALGEDLVCLFGPQHGIFSDVQDNMVESGHGSDPRLRLPVWSLYGETRKPAPEMLEGLDTLIVDIQDVGTRVYTFIWTLKLAMEACGERGIRVVVLDRPNPIGAEEVEGNVLEPEHSSFVGLLGIPMRHGMTIGEVALWFVRHGGVSCDLTVVRMEGYGRKMHWEETGRPWVITSPNLPTPDTALVYPGTVLLEGTNASEGRGTTRPFELVGGPWGGPEELAGELGTLGLPGVHFRPVVFLPTFQKWGGTNCKGVQLHVTDKAAFKPYLTGLAILRTLWKLYRREGFAWKSPPYEYETEKLPIHMLLGSSRVREALEAGEPLAQIEKGWQKELDEWKETRRECLLYQA